MASATDLRNDYSYLESIATVMKERGVEGVDDMTTDDLYNWGIENYRWMQSNELSAADEAFRVTTGSDAEKQAYANYYQKLEGAEGTFWEDPLAAVGDYALSTAAAPSTWLGLFSGGTGKAAGFGAGAAARETMKSAFRAGVNQGISNGLSRQAAAAVARESVKKAITRQVVGSAAKKIGTAAAVEGGASALTDYSIQKTEQAVGLRDEVDQGRVALMGGIGAATAGVLEGGAGYMIGRSQAKKAGEFSNVVARGDAINRASIDARLKAIGQDRTAIEVFKDAKDYAVNVMADREAQLLRGSGEAVVDEVTGQLITRSPFGNALPGSSNPLTGSMVKTGLDDDVALRVAGALTEIWKATGVKYKKGSGFARTLATAMGDQRLTSDTISQIARNYGLTWGQLRDAVYSNPSGAGKTLIEWRYLAEKMGADLTVGQAEFAQAVKGRQNAGRIVAGWKRLDNWRRGLMVTQIATTARNSASTVYRGAMDTLVNAVDYGIAKLTGTVGYGPGAYKGQFSQIADPLYYMFANPKLAGEMYDATMKHFGDEADRMIANIADFNIHLGTDGSRLGKIGQTIDRGVAMANGLNNFVDGVAKKAAFVTALRKKLARQGIDFMDVVRNGDVSRLDPKLIAEATDEALYFTFQGPSKINPFNKWDSFGSKLENPISQLAFVAADFMRTNAIPFPRFMVNSIKYLLEHSPAGLAYSLGDMAMKGNNHITRQQVAKGVVGTAFMLGLTAWRTDTITADGAEQGEWKLPNDGRYLDLAPYFPLAPMAYFADAYARVKNGLPWKFEAAKFMEAMSGSNFRAGSGVYALDQMVNDIMAMREDWEKDTWQPAVERLIGGYFGAFFASAGSMKDVYAQFDPEASLVRDSKEAPFDASLGRYVPFPLKRAALELAGEDPDQSLLPPASTLAAGGELHTQSPLIKQITGANMRADRNRLEELANSLGVDYQTMKQKSVDPAYERLIDNLAYPVIVSDVLPQMEEDWFKNAHPHYQKLWIKEQMQTVKKAAREYASELNPELSLYEEFYRKGGDEQRSIIMDLGLSDDEGAAYLQRLREQGRARQGLPATYSSLR